MSAAKTGARIALRPAEGRAAPAAWIVTPSRSATRSGAGRRARHLPRGRDDGAASWPRWGGGAVSRPVVAPLFAAVAWPRYQITWCEQRADTGLLRLLNDLTAEGAMTSRPVDLAGYSGGAQFSHRFAWLHPSRVPADGRLGGLVDVSRCGVTAGHGRRAPPAGDGVAGRQAARLSRPAPTLRGSLRRDAGPSPRPTTPRSQRRSPTPVWRRC